MNFKTKAFSVYQKIKLKFFPKILHEPFSTGNDCLMLLSLWIHRYQCFKAFSNFCICIWTSYGFVVVNWVTHLLSYTYTCKSINYMFPYGLWLTIYWKLFPTRGREVDGGGVAQLCGVVRLMEDELTDIVVQSLAWSLWTLQYCFNRVDWFVLKNFN